MKKKMISSFLFAWQGLLYCFQSQRNMKIHFFITLIIFLLSFWLQLTRAEFLAVILIVALVWVAEIINTALEKVIDICAPHYHPLAEVAKNVAAGAVLVSAFFALIIGILVFGEKLLHFLIKN
jgi:diacylglycerol kinase